MLVADSSERNKPEIKAAEILKRERERGGERREVVELELDYSKKNQPA